MGSHQGRVEGEKNLPRPAGHTLLNAPQETIGLLGNQGTLLAHGQLVIHQDTHFHLHRAAFHQVSPEPILVHGVIPPQVQDPAEEQFVDDSFAFLVLLVFLIITFLQLRLMKFWTYLGYTSFRTFFPMSASKFQLVLTCCYIALFRT